LSEAEGEVDGEAPYAGDEANADEEVLFDGAFFVEEFLSASPIFELFEDLSSLLPAHIDLADISTDSNAPGIKEVMNFLSVCNLTVDDLSGASKRVVETRIRAANTHLTNEFQKFRSQYIGNKRRIEIEFELEHHDSCLWLGQAFITW